MGRVRTIRFFFRWRISWIAKAIAKYDLPVPAGPMRNKMSCCWKVPHAILWAAFLNSMWKRGCPFVGAVAATSVLLFGLVVSVFLLGIKIPFCRIYACPKIKKDRAFE
jgi:hypothetical protein